MTTNSLRPTEPPGWRFVVRRWFFGLAVAATLVALFYAVENWRGKRAWMKYKARLAAAGEQFEWRTNRTPAIPADQNFAQTPLLQAIGTRHQVDTQIWERVFFLKIDPIVYKLGNWTDGGPADLEACVEYFRSRGLSTNSADATGNPGLEILKVVSQLDSELNELRTASQRPYAQFPLEGEDPVTMPVPNLVAYRKLSELLSLHASAALKAGQTQAAYDDVYVIHRLAAAIKDHPMVTSTMTRGAILRSYGLQPFWEGWLANQWSDRHLEQFQALFESINLVADYDRAIRIGERGAVNFILDNYSRERLAKVLVPKRPYEEFYWHDAILGAVIRLGPRGWRHQNQRFYNELVRELIFTKYDLAPPRVYPDREQANLGQLAASFRTSPYRMIAGATFPHFSKLPRFCTLNQTAIQQAAIACALERYRRAHGAYPDALEALVPGFLKVLPLDLVTGFPYRYRRDAGRSFMLYSPGWNLKDEQGQGPGLSSDPFKTGDWVWPMNKRT